MSPSSRRSRRVPTVSDRSTDDTRPDADTAVAAAVGSDLKAYAVEVAEAGVVQTGGAFTDLPEADALVKSSPEAFLIGVLFTQGISAERAWAGPYLLRERLGHLDLRRLADEPEAVREAVQRPPMLHRFKETLPRWISGSAELLLMKYEGDATRIWAPGSKVPEVTGRLREFPGVGRKKAAMAVEMLVRHLGVELGGIASGQVAYDVHVRRVFLRCGLVRRDDPEQVAEAARWISPEEPGLLDLPAWLVGREWCRPRGPRCESCRLGATCPRLTDLDVEGVGVRKSGGGPSRRP